MEHPLVGKAVQFNCGGQRTGRYCGIVRRVVMTKKGIKSIIVQRVGGPGAVGGKGYSAQCGGDRHRLTLDELISVSWYGKMRSVDEFLENEGTL